MSSKIDYQDPNFYWVEFEKWRRVNIPAMKFDYTKDYWPMATYYMINKKIEDDCRASLEKAKSSNRVWRNAVTYNTKRPLVDNTNLFF